MTSPTTATRSPKKPTDHQPSKSDLIAAKVAARPDGADLLRPVTDLRSGEIANARADIIELFEEMGVKFTTDEGDDEEASVDPAAVLEPGSAEAKSRTADIPLTSQTLRVLGRLGEVLESYAIDTNAYAQWDRGAGSQERVTDLAMWFLTALGE